MSLLGFEIKIDPSWFLIAALITWSLATGYFPFVIEDATVTFYFAMALAAMILLFGSLILHELAHALSGRATLISRLRLDASLFAPPPARHARTTGRPAQKGVPLPKLKTLLEFRDAMANDHGIVLVRPTPASGTIDPKEDRKKLARSNQKQA